MESNNFVLSICIPTYGIIDFVIPAIESIFLQGVDNTLFEVIITDNGKDSELGKVLEKYDYPNLRYIKTESNGFQNQIDSFKQSHGLFIKMINHKSRIKSGYLQKLIDFVLVNKEDKPSLYFSNGHLGNDSIIECDDFESFVRQVSFWTSWEEGVGVWREDLPKFDAIKFDKMFPAASILFGVREESKFIIWNECYSYQNKSDRIRRYDFFRVFAVNFLDMINDLRRENRITIDTFDFVRHDMYRRYLISYYNQILVRKKDKSIPLNDIAKNMSVYYSYGDYIWMKFYSYTILNLKRWIVSICSKWI